MKHAVLSIVILMSGVFSIQAQEANKTAAKRPPKNATFDYRFSDDLKQGTDSEARLDMIKAPGCDYFRFLPRVDWVPWQYQAASILSPCVLSAPRAYPGLARCALALSAALGMMFSLLPWFVPLLRQDLALRRLQAMLGRKRRR